MIGLDRLMKKILKPRIMVDQIFPAILGSMLSYSKNRSLTLYPVFKTDYFDITVDPKKGIDLEFLRNVRGRNLIKSCRLD